MSTATMRPAPTTRAAATSPATRRAPGPLAGFALLPLVLALGACGDDEGDYDFAGSQAGFEEAAAAAAPPQASFDPAAGEIPFPNDLLFVDRATGMPSPDGTLNVPVESIDLDGDGEVDGPSPTDPVLALNQMDGFSTVAPISIDTSAPVTQASVVVGETVRVFEVTSDPATTGVNGVVRELGATELAAAATDAGIALLPVVPLAPSTRYLVVVTTGVAGANGEALAPTLQYGLTAGTTELTGQAAALEPVRLATQAQLGTFEAFEAAAAVGGEDDGDDDGAGAPLTRADVAISFTFTTQSIRPALQAAEDQATARPLVLAPTGQSTAPLGAGGLADVWVGSLELPYYLSAPGDGDGPEADLQAINSVWRNAAGDPVNPTDFAPQATGTVTVPVVLTVPNAASPSGGNPPEGGWPVTIFQHGIIGDRSLMLPLADAMAGAGRVLIAIDQPVHGIVPGGEGPLAAAADQLAAGSAQLGATERHFGIDLVDASGAPGSGPDGEIDPSGTHFINLGNLGNTRDNLREAAADLMTLSASLGGAVVPVPEVGPTPSAQAGLPLNVADKSFVGHSLGGIVGTVMLSYDDSFTAGSLAMPGGGIAQLVANSERLGPSITGGLAAGAGVDPTDEAALAEFVAGDLQTFLVAAQTVIDSGDPINHAPFLAADDTTPIHLVEVEGDDVIPNAVPTAPLAGTRPLARVLGLPRVAASASGDAYVRFSEGDHGTILSPEASAAATAEMQRQIAAYAASGGTQLPIEDASVIAPLDEEEGQ